MPFLGPLRSEVVAYAKDGDKTDQEPGETHGLICTRSTGKRTNVWVSNKSDAVDKARENGNKALM